ncbi:hypothetical protein [Spongiactinospora gelatinilytica]|uniref:hypothetical protein n=1 Tax=Spongiactinospora gelatinilytica TaxID=2666298 RepID=UPI0011B93F57|nr:hypothetical protein [Spongiactinospora gelatinilytica]
MADPAVQRPGGDPRAQNRPRDAQAAASPGRRRRYSWAASIEPVRSYGDRPACPAGGSPRRSTPPGANRTSSAQPSSAHVSRGSDLRR